MAWVGHGYMLGLGLLGLGLAWVGFGLVWLGLLLSDGLGTHVKVNGNNVCGAVVCPKAAEGEGGWVLDLGSHCVRVGWLTEDTLRVALAWASGK